SISQQNDPATNGGPVSPHKETLEHHSLGSKNGSLRQSPPPGNNLLIPSGAITTPPDSSDDEDRGRDLGNLKELHDALKNIDVKRAGSPVRDGKPTPVPPVTVPFDFSSLPRALPPE